MKVGLLPSDWSKGVVENSIRKLSLAAVPTDRDVPSSGRGPCDI
jgi:hypothetical protein